MGTFGNFLSGGLLGLLGLQLTAGVPFIGKETGEEPPVLRPGLEGSGKVWQESSDTGGKGALNPKWPSTKLEGGSEDVTSPPVCGEEAPSENDSTIGLAIHSHIAAGYVAAGLYATSRHAGCGEGIPWAAARGNGPSSKRWGALKMVVGWL